jgi:hypothetical protein
LLVRETMEPAPGAPAIEVASRRAALKNSVVRWRESFEERGLLIFVESAVIEPLDGRILDVRFEKNRTELFFR